MSRRQRSGEISPITTLFAPMCSCGPPSPTSASRELEARLLPAAASFSLSFAFATLMCFANSVAKSSQASSATNASFRLGEFSGSFNIDSASKLETLPRHRIVPTSSARLGNDLLRSHGAELDTLPNLGAIALVNRWLEELEALVAAWDQQPDQNAMPRLTQHEHAFGLCTVTTPRPRLEP